MLCILCTKSIRSVLMTILIKIHLSYVTIQLWNTCSLEHIFVLCGNPIVKHLFSGPHTCPMWQSNCETLVLWKHILVLCDNPTVKHLFSRTTTFWGGTPLFLFFIHYQSLPFTDIILYLDILFLTGSSLVTHIASVLLSVTSIVSLHGSLLEACSTLWEAGVIILIPL